MKWINCFYRALCPFILFFFSLVADFAEFITILFFKLFGKDKKKMFFTSTVVFVSFESFGKSRYILLGKPQRKKPERIRNTLATRENVFEKNWCRCYGLNIDTVRYTIQVFTCISPMCNNTVRLNCALRM